MPVHGLKCQKCNSPLRIDHSLVGLSTAQQKLLVGKVNYGDIVKTNLNPQDFIPADRLKLYNEITKEDGGTRKALYESLSDESDDEGAQGKDKKDDKDSADVSRDSAGHVEEGEDENHTGTSLSNSHSFVLLSSGKEDEEEADEHDAGRGNKKENHPKTIAQRIATLNNIFQILSSNQNIDHPLCLECSDLLLENFKLKFDQNQKERDQYLSFLRKLKGQENAFNTNNELDGKLNSTLKEFNQLRKLESKRLSELKTLESQKLELDNELLDLEREYDQLVNGELNAVLQSKNQTDLFLSQKVNDLEKSKASYQNYLDRLDELRGLNIYKEIFTINFDSQYGTINGFRLGYKVPWPENNAALGQIVLLLVFLLKRFNIKLEQYKLVPLGSQSHIVKITKNTTAAAPLQASGTVANGANGVAGRAGPQEATEAENRHVEHKTKTILDLHTSNEFSLGKLFNFNKLDVSMIALLEIVTQIESKILEVDPEIVLPYAISHKRDTIGGKSIRVTSNGEWTLSCKFLLTNLNWLLSHSSVHEHDVPA